jgi:hypothetical protein
MRRRSYQRRAPIEAAFLGEFSPDASTILDEPRRINGFRAAFVEIRRSKKVAAGRFDPNQCRARKSSGWRETGQCRRQASRRRDLATL